MRLVTYDRAGARRLGAWVADGVVVDLPDAVGHPVFPTTMEALVARSGGTTLDAARDALERPDHWEDCVVERPRLLVPILPSSRPPLCLGPGEELPWPGRGVMVDCRLGIACVVGSPARNLSAAQAASAIFGYTLVVEWTAREEAEGGEGAAARGRSLAASIGPCVVTAGDFDPSTARLVARVDDEEWAEGDQPQTRLTFPELIAAASRLKELLPGDLLGSPGAGARRGGRRLTPGALVEIEAPGIGVLRNRIGRAAA